MAVPGVGTGIHLAATPSPLTCGIGIGRRGSFFNDWRLVDNHVAGLAVYFRFPVLVAVVAVQVHLGVIELEQG